MTVPPHDRSSSDRRPTGPASDAPPGLDQSVPSAPARHRLEEDLRKEIRGDVRVDPTSLGIHATDASHYQITPACVVVPRDREDVERAVRIARSHDLAITARGSATSLSGQTFGPGMVLDVSKHMNRILEVDPQQGWARVEPGVIRDQLNRHLAGGDLARHRLHFAPDPATANRASIGGMIGNNSSGMRSVVYGKTIDHVLEATVLLSDGTVLELTERSPAEWAERSAGTGREAEIHRGVRRLIEENEQEIRDRYPKVMRRVSGYNLDEFVDGAGYTGPIGPRDCGGPRAWNLANLIVGSEGTLAVLLEAKVRLTPLPEATALCIVHFDDLLDSLRAMPAILAHEPSAVELLDEFVMAEAKVNAATAPLAGFVDGTPSAVQIVEFFGSSSDGIPAAADAAQKAENLAADLEASGVGYAWPVRTDPTGMAEVWKVRSLGLGLISNVKGPVKGQAFVEDACVPVEHLPEYIEKLLHLAAETDTDISVYAHASVGVLHTRPMVDLHLEADRIKMEQIARAAFDWVTEYGGTFAGEHGDGLVRGQFVPEAFGPDLYEAFRSLKSLFDPAGLMNPGKILDTPGMVEHLRYGDQYQPTEVDVQFRYDSQGGFVLAVEQCNGVGACRKLDSGTMCPSYMATRDEDASTRGRANALRLAMSGQLGPDGLVGDGVHDVLDLCLSCKACKTECPNNVDMAKLRADVLQLRHDAQGAPLGARLIASMADLAPLLSGPTARLVNATQNRTMVRSALERVAGIDRRRPLPNFAPVPLDRTLRRRNLPTSGMDGPDVVLFDDTWVNHYEPQIGVAAVELLESCGFRVTLARAGDAQRPRLSKGFVRAAKARAEHLFEALDQAGEGVAPIVCLEPSDASALVDDLPDLLDDRDLSARVADRVQMIDVFLAAEQAAGRVGPFHPASGAPRSLALHGHCHQKALFGTSAMIDLLRSADDVEVEQIEAGCCGMAGSFGFEHFDLSRQVGEDRLFPAVRSAVERGRSIVASGVSCRHQLHDLLGVDALHWVETLRGTPAGAGRPGVPQGSAG